ncbi:hypothetical protein OFN61_40320, partial [Escherichia coli]|nr:hypothetical protein [Escherichia coli]
MQHMVAAASARLGVCCAVMNARGCSTTTLLTPKVFCGAWTEDVRAVVRYLRHVVGEAVPLFAVAYSLGAGILS